MKKKHTYAIKVENLTKEFYLAREARKTVRDYVLNIFRPLKKKKFIALDDISFAIKPGESLGIIGPNGSGKSTLLKILSGIYHPTKGRVKTRGRIISFLELGVGFNDDLTGRENVFLNGVLLGMKKEYLKNQFKKIVDYSGIDKQFLDTPMKYYSSGMKLRLAFSVAIHAEADIYIMDEVLSVGDNQFQEKSKKIFTELSQQGKTIILVSHNLANIREFCTKVLYLDKGKLVSIEKSEIAIERYELTNSVSKVDEKIINKQLSKYLYGNNGAEFLSVRLQNSAGKSTHIFHPGEKYRLLVRIKFNKECLNPVFGVKFRFQPHQELYGINTSDIENYLGSYKKDDEVEVTIDDKIPFNVGEYKMSVAVAETDRSNKYISLIGLNNYLTLKVIGRQQWGLIYSKYRISKKLIK